MPIVRVSHIRRVFQQTETDEVKHENARGNSRAVTAQGTQDVTDEKTSRLTHSESTGNVGGNPVGT